MIITYRLSAPLAIFLTAAACSADVPTGGSPHEVYSQYDSLVKEGRSFEKDRQFYSEARQAEVMASAKSQATAAGRSVDEHTQLYLTFTQDLAQCGKLTLVEERIEGKSATLHYAREDVCDAGGEGPGELKVELVDENGWKIVYDIIKL